MSRVRCQGWWEQLGLGRQSMDDLILQFDGHRLAGSGVDVVGPFTLNGRINTDGVIIEKQYLGRHAVEYLGDYDGEGTMRGLWSIYGVGGEWMIKIVSHMEGDSIREWQPGRDRN